MIAADRTQSNSVRTPVALQNGYHAAVVEWRRACYVGKVLPSMLVEPRQHEPGHLLQRFPDDWVPRSIDQQPAQVTSSSRSCEGANFKAYDSYSASAIVNVLGSPHVAVVVSSGPSVPALPELLLECRYEGVITMMRPPCS